jgi:hypothetical protein
MDDANHLLLGKRPIVQPIVQPKPDATIGVDRRATPDNERLSLQSES